MQRKKNNSVLDENMLSSDKISKTDNRLWIIHKIKWLKVKSVNIIKNNWIALIALFISGFTLYFQFFNKTHNFQGVVLNYVVDAYGDMSSNVVLINDGTYYEVLFNSELIYSNSKDFRGQVFVAGKSKQCPIMLKPGERTLCLIEDKSTTFMIPLRIEGENWYNENRKNALSWIEKKKQPYIVHCGILFDVIGESGKKHKILSYIGSMTFQKEPPFFVWPNSETNIEVNLHKNKFIHSGDVTRWDVR